MFEVLEGLCLIFPLGSNCFDVGLNVFNIVSLLFLSFRKLGVQIFNEHGFAGDRQRFQSVLIQ